MKTLLTFVYPCMILLLLFSCKESENTENNEHEKLAEIRTAPFSAVKFEDENVWVQVEETWYQLLKIDSLDATWILNACKLEYEDDYQKRFSEDLVEFLHTQEIHPREREKFLLKNQAGETTERELTFTKQKRATSLAYFRKHYDSQKAIDSEKLISKSHMLQDIDALEEILHKHHSYLHLKKLDIDSELNHLRENLPEEQRLLDFGAQLSKFINKLGDGHARVDRWDINDMGVLPFQTQAFQGKVLAYAGEELLEEEYPYLVSVNDVPVENLLKTAKEYLIPDTSPHFVEVFAARRLQKIGFLLAQHQASPTDKMIRVVLSNGTGKRVEKPFSLDKSENLALLKQIAGSLMKEGHISYKKQENNIGYLRIRTMTSRNAPEEIKEAMDELSQTKGLVIDVRNNGGGGRQTLLELMPYFIPPNHPPIVGNLGIYRTDNPDIPKEGVLKNRFMYPLSSAQYTESDKALLRSFLKNFHPNFSFDPDKFTDWHFLLIKPSDEKKFYDKPVVVLMNGGCFSATDIFLSSFKQLDHVSLIGTTSGGGSGRTRKHTLPNSGWPLRLSSIISFQPHGDLYEGNGVSPNIEVPLASLDDALGKTDNQLTFALQHIQKQSP